jgi:hypothetical protein
MMNHNFVVQSAKWTKKFHVNFANPVVMPGPFKLVESRTNTIGVHGILLELLVEVHSLLLGTNLISVVKTSTNADSVQEAVLMDSQK